MKDYSDEEKLTCGLSVEREVGATGFIWVRRTVQRSTGGLTGTPGSGHRVLGLLDLSRGLASHPSRPRRQSTRQYPRLQGSLTPTDCKRGPRHKRCRWPAEIPSPSSTVSPPSTSTVPSKIISPYPICHHAESRSEAH